MKQRKVKIKLKENGITLIALVITIRNVIYL